MMKNCQQLSRTTRISNLLFIAMLSVGLVALANTAWAEAEALHEEHSLAKQSQNPVASLISLPFENNATFNNGRDDDFINILNVKPVIPMGLTENWNPPRNSFPIFTPVRPIHLMRAALFRKFRSGETRICTRPCQWTQVDSAIVLIFALHTDLPGVRR